MIHGAASLAGQALTFSHPNPQLPRAVGFSVAEGKTVELDAIAERVRPIAAAVLTNE